MRTVFALLLLATWGFARSGGDDLRRIVVSAPELRGWTQVQAVGSHRTPHARQVLDLAFKRGHAHLTIDVLRFDSVGALQAVMKRRRVGGASAAQQWPILANKGRVLIALMLYETHPELGDQGMRPGAGMTSAELRRLMARILAAV